AMDGMLNLLTNMPESKVLFSLSKEAVIKKIQTERITKSDVLFNYEKAKKLGLDYDIRKDIYDKAPNLKIEDIKTFFNKYIKDKKYTILVLGDIKEMNAKALSKYGKVKYLTLEDVFGY
ncbi:MAG: hypothetical protein K8R79_11050, partial [Calditrichales bacterium]|nr:hypothetical protein [Calditrichales bacterium]